MLPLLFVLVGHLLQPGNESVEFRQPQLGAGRGPGEVMITFASKSAIYYASSKDGGNKFSSPVTVSETGALALGHHRGPRVSLAGDAIVISAIDGGNLAIWRSTDNGKNWDYAGVVNQVPGSAKEGMHAIASDGHGNLFAVWLESRTPGMRLFGAASKDGGLTWSKNVQIYSSPDGTICQCCAPSVAIDENGQIWVMFRNFLDGDRDLYLTHSLDGISFAPAARLGMGSWPLNGCPMDGGGLVASNGHVISAWRREDDLFLAEPGHAEYRMGQGKDVAVAAGPKGTYVIWSGAQGLQLWKTGMENPIEVGGPGAYPVLTTLEDGSVLAAWEYKGAIRIEKMP